MKVNKFHIILYRWYWYRIS